MIDIAKAEIYQSLAANNLATEQMTEHLERLRDAGLLLPHIAEIRILAAQQTCAETNTTALLALAQWANFWPRLRRSIAGSCWVCS